MIFFGTLMAAGLLALGEPRATPSLAAPSGGEPSLLLVLRGAWPEPAAPPPAR
jgi:hypothetical protein